MAALRGGCTAKPSSCRPRHRCSRLWSRPDPKAPSTSTCWRDPPRSCGSVRAGSRVAEAWRDGDEVAGRLDLAEPYRGDLDAWAAHPALVDVATTFGMVLGDDAERLYVPIGYDAVASFGALPAAPWVRARPSGVPSDDLLRLDIELGDDAGNVLLSIEGLALRPIVDSEALSLADEPDRVPAEPSAASAQPSHRVPLLMAVADAPRHRGRRGSRDARSAARERPRPAGRVEHGARRPHGSRRTGAPSRARRTRRGAGELGHLGARRHP